MARRPRLCPCGCRQPVRPGKTYAAGACYLRCLPIDVRRSNGREGGYTTRTVRQRTLIESLVHLDRDAAILEAYRRGRRAMYHTNDWARKRATQKAVA